MAEQVLLRTAFNKKNVTELAKRIKKVYKEFNEEKFIEDINSKLEPLSFGDRSKLITKTVKKHLPKNFKEATKILIKSLEPENTKTELTGFYGFITWPLTEYIAENGLEEENYETSMHALKEMTKRFSSENSIRAFIKKYPEKTLKKLNEWIKDKNVHVRRLVSEGTRPRLPLCCRLPEFQKNPKPVIKLLRSVANNLNDISKDNPKIVTDLLKKWKQSKNKETQWLVTHALRTLLKQGNQDALELLGYTKNPQIQVSKITLKNKTIKIGNKIEFEFTITSQSKTKQTLMIDYTIHYMKKNKKQAEKVFKLSKKTINPNEIISITKRHSVKQMSTRKHYPGKHDIELQINGKKHEKTEFILE